MQGNDTTPEHRTIEFGLDVTPLLSYVDPGKPYKFFLIVDEKDPENLSSGQVKHFSLINYQEGFEEIICDQQNVPLVENGRTLLSVIYEPPPTDLAILTETLPVYEPGQPMLIQLEAEGGQTPYHWQLDKNYQMNSNEAAFPQTDDLLIIEESGEDSLAVQALDFEFPFYGCVFDTVVVSSSGYICFDENMYFWSYIVDLAYFLKNSRAIAPLLCQDMIVYPGYDLGVWYEGDDTQATFRWRTAINNELESTVLNFAATLYPDGTINFFYDEIILDENIRWTAGISDGDFYNHSLPELPDPPDIIPGTRIEFFPTPQPKEISLSKGGELEILELQESTFREIKVVVIDNTMLSTTRSYPFTDALEFSLNIQGDEDLKINNGQVLALDLIITNRGSAAIQDLDFILDCSHSMLELLDDQQHLSYIGSGESIEVPGAFNCFCDGMMPDNQQMLLKLRAIGSEKAYQRYCMLRSVAPALELVEFKVLNDINLLEPGQTEDLQIRMVNNGNRNSINTIAVLSSDHQGITINTVQPISLGTIEPWNSSTLDVSITADYSISFGSEVNFLIELTDEIGLITEISFSMSVGSTPVCIIEMDPETNSGSGILEVLQRMEVECDYRPSFPLSMNNYQSVILCLGKHFSNHELTWQQGLILEEYLDHGGNIYIEGRLIWEQEPHLPILDRFSLGTVLSPGMYEILYGVDSTFTEGLVYESVTQQPFCYFYLEPTPPAFSIFTGHEYPNCVAVAYDAGSYKTIGTIFELGALLSSDTCLVDTFMQRVLNFFDIKYGVTHIEEIPGGEIAPVLKNYPNPFRHQTRIPIKLEKRSFVDAAVFDLQGRRIFDFITATTLESGVYNLRWEGNANDGNAVPDGIYIYRILIDGIPYTGKMVLIR